MMDLMTNAAVGDHAATAPPWGGSTARRLVAGLLVPLVTIVIVVLGLRAAGRLPAVQAVGFGLVLVGALSGAILARSAQRVALWQVAFGALAASVALTAARLGDQPGGHQVARGVATFAVPVVIAISVNMLLALPDGRLASRGRRISAGIAYAAAAGSGLVLAAAGRPFPAWAVAVAWPIAAACAPWRLPRETGSGCNGWPSEPCWPPIRRWWPGSCTCSLAGRARSPPWRRGARHCSRSA